MLENSHHSSVSLSVSIYITKGCLWRPFFSKIMRLGITKLTILFFILSLAPVGAFSQRLIEYQAGLGSRDPEDPDVWILYNRVRATHEGMVLYADSALLNTQRNDFTAFDHIRIDLTDTTSIFGDQLFYDGNTRIVDIWADTVVFVDGKTVLRTAHLSFDRNANVATYDTWGHTVSGDRVLDSREGNYDATTKEFFIYRKVCLMDSSLRLVTDTLLFNTVTNVARFVSPTNIYSDSTVIYSEYGNYNTDTRVAVSTKNSRVLNSEKLLTCDTLFYYDSTQYGRAFGNVVIIDSMNDITCYGRYGETDQGSHQSFVTDSALVVFVDRGDSVFLHADTVRVRNDSQRRFSSVSAYNHVKVYRSDAQGMCDSAYYSVNDSLLTLFEKPVLWYGNYQCTADTILVFHDTVGVRLSLFRSNVFVSELVDSTKFNQVKGRNGAAYFVKGEPNYADILGNAQMVYYITEEDSLGNVSLVGVNAGIGSDMRIYFFKRQMERLVTYGKPDMHTYPLKALPDNLKRLEGFVWLDSRRPRTRFEIFQW